MGPPNSVLRFHTNMSLTEQVGLPTAQPGHAFPSTRTCSAHRRQWHFKKYGQPRDLPYPFFIYIAFPSLANQPLMLKIMTNEERERQGTCGSFSFQSFLTSKVKTRGVTRRLHVMKSKQLVLCSISTVLVRVKSNARTSDSVYV